MSDMGNYQGREQSYIKHRFLSKYLQEAAFKIIQGRTPVFNFVDGFAGPWRISDKENYSDASFEQALRTLEVVRARLAELPGLKIRFCFCERKDQAYLHLRKHADKREREFAETHNQFEFKAVSGSFEKRLGEIAEFCRDGFTFTFIDPTGWDIDSAPILEFLKEQRGEFLVNFMEEHINRHAGYSQVAESFGRFLADPEWACQFDALPSEWSNGEKVLHLFREKIKRVGAATYLVDFPIEKPGEKRVKMRLLLGTHSRKGMEVFRDVQWRVEQEAVTVQDRSRRDERQDGLFTPEEIAALRQGLTGIGSSRFRREAEERIKRMLARKKTTTFGSIAKDILEHVPMRLTQIRDLARAMKKRCVVSYELPPRRQVPQDDTKISLAPCGTKGGPLL